MKHFTANRRGIGLIELMMLSVLFPIVMMTLISLLRTLGRAERGIATNSDLTKITNTLHLIFESNTSCAKSGLINTVLNPADPGITPITIKFPATAGPGAVYLEEGGTVDSRKITSVRFNSMVNLDGVYLSILQITTQPIGSALSMRDPNLTIPLNVVLDSSNRVTSCQVRSSFKGFYSGVTTVKYPNNVGTSDKSVPIPIPTPCVKPTVLTQTYTDSIGCSDGASKLKNGCSIVGGTRSQDIHSYAKLAGTPPTSFQVFLSASYPVCVGVSGSAPAGTSCSTANPDFEIGYFLSCN